MYQGQGLRLVAAVAAAVLILALTVNLACIILQGAIAANAWDEVSAKGIGIVLAATAVARGLLRSYNNQFSALFTVGVAVVAFAAGYVSLITNLDALAWILAGVAGAGTVLSYLLDAFGIVKSKWIWNKSTQSSAPPAVQSPQG